MELVSDEARLWNSVYWPQLFIPFPPDLGLASYGPWAKAVSVYISSFIETWPRLFIHIWLLYAIMTKLSNYNGEHWGCCAYNTYYLAFYRNSLLTAGLAMVTFHRSRNQNTEPCLLLGNGRRKAGWGAQRDILRNNKGATPGRWQRGWRKTWYQEWGVTDHQMPQSHEEGYGLRKVYWTWK